MTSHGVRVVSDMSAVEIANRNLKKVRMAGEVSILNPFHPKGFPIDE